MRPKITRRYLAGTIAASNVGEEKTFSLYPPRLSGWDLEMKVRKDRFKEENPFKIM